MKKIIVILLSVLAVTACKKNNTKPGKTTPVLSDRLLVSKSVSTDSESDSATNHTITFYTYDDSNRLVKKIDNAIYDNIIYGSTITIDTTTYTYDAQGNLTASRLYQPSYGSITYIYYTAGVPDSSTISYYYKGIPGPPTKTTYKVVNGQITQSITVNDIVHISYDSNNNVSGISDPNNGDSEKYTYDNAKKSPFYICHFKWNILSPQIEFNQNPELSEYATAPDDFTGTTTYKNTYNTQGYLTKASYTVVTTGATGGETDNSGVVQTTVYTYINAK